MDCVRDSAVAASSAVGAGSGSAMGAGSASASTALARDLREENLLLSDALRAAEEALAAARSKASEGEDYFDNSTVSYEIKVRNLTKNLEFQEARVAQLRADAAEQQGKIERYRSLEEVLGKENEALRKDLKETREERDRALRRAEASEIMAAHAKNEVAALESGQVSEPEIYDENIELKREIAIANSARATTDEHLKVTLAHLRAAREENVRITEELLKKTEEHLDNESRLAELEQMMDGATLRESTNSKELAIAVQERNDAVNRVKVFEKDTKRLSGEVERLVGRLGDAERSALREKERFASNAPNKSKSTRLEYQNKPRWLETPPSRHKNKRLSRTTHRWRSKNSSMSFTRSGDDAWLSRDRSSTWRRRSKLSKISRPTPKRR